MIKHLFLLPIVAMSTTVSTAQRLHKSANEIKSEMTRKLQQDATERLEKRSKMLDDMGISLHSNAIADPTMAARKANGMHKAVALEEQDYRLRLDSIVTPNEQKRVITTNVANNRWSHEDVYAWMNNEWVLREKIDYSYDMGGVTMTTYFMYDDPVYAATRYTSDYDSRGNMTLEIKEYIPVGGTEWMGEQKLVAKYFDGSFDLIADLRNSPLYCEVWTGGEKSGEWTLTMKYATEFDKDGNNTYYEMQQLGSNGLVGEYTRVTKGEGKAVTSETFGLYNGEWVLTYTASIDEQGYATGHTKMTVDANGVVTQTVETRYEFGNGYSGYVNEYIRTKDGDGEWYDTYKFFYTFDEKGAVTKQESWKYDEKEQKLVLDYEVTYKNDKNGHHLTSHEAWRDDDTKVWRDVYDYTYTYDGDNIAEDICFDLEENKYIEKRVYTYFTKADRSGVRTLYYRYGASQAELEETPHMSTEVWDDKEGRRVYDDYQESYGAIHYRHEYAYSATGKYESNASYTWMDGKQTAGYKKDIEVDDKEREVLCLTSNFNANTGEWMPEYRREMGYDAEGYINRYRYWRTNDGVTFSGVKGYDIVVSAEDGLTSNATINYELAYPEWKPSLKEETKKNEWGELVQTTTASYNENLGQWFAITQDTYLFDTSHFGCYILGGGKNHYMVTTFHQYNSGNEKNSTYYYNEVLPEVVVSEDEPVVMAVDPSLFMVEIEISDPKQPDYKPIETPEFEAVIMEEETVVAVSVPAPVDVTDLVNPNAVAIYFTPYSDDELDGAVRKLGERQSDKTSLSQSDRRKEAGKDAKYTLVIKAGSLSFNHLVYMHDITLPINLDASLLTGVESIATTVGKSVATYDLMGRKITAPSKGLYIKDGKKVVK